MMRAIGSTGRMGLGMRRLSIIDLATGRQPISNEDGTIWVVFNGEIYNYRELRASLIRSGHRFRTYSDTEVLVHLYEEEGVDGIQRLRGMFAYAIWDSRERSLLLVRDRFGKKPLYYRGASARSLFWKRAEVPARGRRSAGARSGSAAALFPAGLHSRSLDALCGDSQTRARRLAALSRGWANRRGPLLDSACRRRSGPAGFSELEACEYVRKSVRPSRQNAPGLGCSRGRLSERRDRFHFGGGVHGAAKPPSLSKHFRSDLKSPDSTSFRSPPRSPRSTGPSITR